MLTPDLTTFWQMLVFLGVYLVLTKFLFGPFLRLKDLRDEATAETTEDGTGAADPTLELLRRIETRNRELAAELAGVREKLVSQAASDSSVVLGEASEKAAQAVAEAESKIDDTFKQISGELQKQQDVFVQQLVTKLTGQGA